MSNIRRNPKCRIAAPFEGDWRDKFENGLPSSHGLGLPQETLTLLSFDPYLYSIHTFENGPNLYREDLVRTLDALPHEGPAIVQLSTYEAQNNPQEAVISSINSALFPGGFTLAAIVRVNGHMMSLVYARYVEWAADLAGLPGRFDAWYEAIRNA